MQCRVLNSSLVSTALLTHCALWGLPLSTCFPSCEVLSGSCQLQPFLILSSQ